MTEIVQTNEMFNYSTLSDASPKSKVLALNAKNDAMPLNEFVGVPMLITDVIMVQGKRSARSNNPETPCINTYLIARTEEGIQAYYSQSDGVANSMRDILTAFPDCNAPEGLVLTCKSRKLPNGNSLKTIVVDLPND